MDFKMISKNKEQVLINLIHVKKGLYESFKTLQK
jgi:hypothetical protein